MDSLEEKVQPPPFVFMRWHTSFDLVSDVWWARKSTYSGKTGLGVHLHILVK